MKRIVLGVCLLSGCQNSITPQRNQTEDINARKYPLLNVQGCHDWDKRFVYARPDIIRTSKHFDCDRKDFKRKKK